MAGKLQERANLIVKTKDEFEEEFPSFFLDLGLDGIVIYDTDGFMENRLKRIREIIAEAGLKRVEENGEVHWEWKFQPKVEWGIDWRGYYDASD